MAEKADIPGWVKVSICVVLFGMTVWGVAWAASKSDATVATLVTSHEKRLTSVEGKQEDQGEAITGIEKAYIKVSATQDSLIQGQKEMKEHISEQNKLMIKRIELDAGIKLLLKSKGIVE